VSNKILEEIKQSLAVDKHEMLVDKLRNQNHDAYYKLDIQFVKKTLRNHEKESLEIIRLYDKIIPTNLLSEKESDAVINSRRIQEISKKIKKLKDILIKELEKLIKENNLEEEKISLDIVDDHSKIKKVLKRKILEKYNNLKIFNTNTDESNIVFEIERQQLRKNYIEELKELLIEYENDISDDERQLRLKQINEELDVLKIEYLTILDKIEKIYSKTTPKGHEYKQFARNCREIFKYDKDDYKSAKDTILKLKNQSDIKTKINEYYDYFIKEKADLEEKEYMEKHILKSNLVSTIKSINQFYQDQLTAREQKVLNEMIENLNEVSDEEFNIYAYKNKIKPILNKIWANSLTDIDTFNNNDHFMFLCSTGNFNDTTIRSFILSDQILVNNNVFGDTYGYICSGEDIILTITEKTTYNKHDIDKQKTPKQIENETANYKISSSIFLNPDKTVVEAMYYLLDENQGIENRKKAQALAKKNDLKLIIIDMNKYKRGN